jgi:hypothetical protein
MFHRVIDVATVFFVFHMLLFHVAIHFFRLRDKNPILYIHNWIYTAYTTIELLMVKFLQPSHEFTFGVGMSFISYPLVLIP